MLVQFSVKNYKGFKEKQIFSLVASTKYKKQENTHTAQSKGYKLLKGAVLYGANASGKSAFVEALHFFRKFILVSSKESLADDNIPTKPFKLSTTTENEPSEFEMIFVEDNMQYRYGFEADVNQVFAEWLYVKDKREVEYFYRDEDGYEYKASKLKVAKMLIEQNMVRSNALLLSVATQFNDPVASKVSDWVRGFSVISGLEAEAYGAVTTIFSKRSEWFKKEVLSYLERSDLDINDYDIQKKNTDDIPESILKDTLLTDDVKTYHTKYDGDNNPTKEPAILDLDSDESKGTQKYFYLAGPILATLIDGSVLVVDELDARLHTKLVSSIIELFHDPNKNPNNAQLIITTHDTNLLDEDIYRRDQVWFVEKDRYGASKLYSLNSFKDNNSSRVNHEKKYLEGRYGAIPYIQELG